MNRRKVLVKCFRICKTHEINPKMLYFFHLVLKKISTPLPSRPMNYESFQWNFSSSTNPEIVRSVLSNKCTWIENDGIKIWQSTLVDTYMQRKIHVLLFISLLLYVGKTSPVGGYEYFVFQIRLELAWPLWNYKWYSKKMKLLLLICNNKK